MEIVYRKYEYMKKMMKPAELKSSTLLGSVERNIGKKATLKNQVWKVGNDYYINIKLWCRVGTKWQHMKYSGLDSDCEVLKDKLPDDRVKITDEVLIKFNKADWFYPTYNKLYDDNLCRAFNKLMGYEWYETAFCDLFTEFFKLAQIDFIRRYGDDI